MKFNFGQFEYDTESMQSFTTHVPDEPTIYMDQNCRVFIKRVHPDGRCVMRRAMTPEIEQLAKLYHIDALMRALRRKPFGNGSPRVNRMRPPKKRGQQTEAARQPA